MSDVLTHPVALAFQEAWAEPTPDRLVALLHADTVLFQPHLPPIRGRDRAYREFELFLGWVPRFRGEVHRAVGNDHTLFIEWTMLFPLAGTRVPVRAVDRIGLRDGLIEERAVYFNPLPLVRQIVRTPTTWRAYWTYRTARRG